MCPEEIPLFPTPADDPKMIGIRQVPFAVADDVLVAKPRSVISRPLGTVAADPSSAVKLFDVLLIVAAKTITRRVSRSLMTISAWLPRLEIRSSSLVLLKLCLC